jgi:hypothetical protein
MMQRSHYHCPTVKNPNKMNEVRFGAGTACKIGTAKRALTSWSYKKSAKRKDKKCERKGQLAKNKQKG